MKKLFYLFISITVLLSACKKEDDSIFKKSADERINEALAKYQAQLTGAENGWKGYIQNNKGETYAFYFVFTNDNHVKMLSDFTGQSAVTIQDAGYRFREQQQPTLIFDTYSYVHILADPNEANAGIFADINISRPTILNLWYYRENDLDEPDISKGLSTDFEFIVDESLIKQDTIKMIGKVNGSKLTFIRATAAEAAIYTSGKWNSNLVSGYLNKEFLTYFDRLNIAGNLFDVHAYSDTTLTFSWLDGDDNIITKTVGFTPTILNGGFTHGIKLSDTVTNGSIILDTLSISLWDPTTRTLHISANNTAGTFTETALPLKIDEAAPGEWNAYPQLFAGGYWASYDGFYSNGVRDAYNNNKDGIDTRFFWLAYFPKGSFPRDFFYPGYISRYNVLAPLFLLPDFSDFDGIHYAIDMPFSSDAGIVKFTLMNNYGYPTTAGPGQTLTQFAISEGYYFVKLDESHYDMVSVKDGKTWLSWFF